MPSQKKPHVVLGGHRVDLTAQSIEGVAVNAGEKAPVAELVGLQTGSKAAAEDEARRFERADPVFDILPRQTDAVGEGSGGHGTEGFHLAADETTARFLAVGDGDSRAGR